MLRGYQTESHLELWEGRIKPRHKEGGVVSPGKYNLEMAVLLTYKDFQWNHCVCQVIKPSISQITYTCQLGQTLFPRRWATVKALLIIILPARKWISPSIYSGSAKLLACGRYYKMESFYSWHSVRYSLWDSSRSTFCAFGRKTFSTSCWLTPHRVLFKVRVGPETQNQ